MSTESTDESNSADMKIDPERAIQLGANLIATRQRIHTASAGRAVRPNAPPAITPPSHPPQVRLIAVSKLKPARDILALTQHPTTPHLDFGENYAQELTAKAALLPASIRWHMVGALQTNKCQPLAARVPNLFAVSSVDSTRKADALQAGRAAGTADPAVPLRVHVQVNTSGEPGKSGCAPGADVAALCRHVRDRCPRLRLAGLMTIGALARSREAGQVNADFVCLRETRDRVVEELGWEGELELSMGMSADFEEAIRQGSDEVRVGTAIFGERPPKSDAVI